LISYGMAVINFIKLTPYNFRIKNNE